MTTTAAPASAPALLDSPAADAAITAAIARACDRIAPAWPLDRLIAVNPYWGFVEAPIERAAARLGALSGATLLMPRAWYRAQWAAGRFTERHLAQALSLAGSCRTPAELLATVARDEPLPARWRLMTDVADTGRDLGHAMPWSEYVTRHVSQTCAAWVDEGQARWTAPDRATGLYPLWRSLAACDGGPRFQMGLRGFRAAAESLPAEPTTLIVEALAALAVPPGATEDYLTALLLSVNGWASACAHRRWEARLRGGDDDALVHLLAVRLAWELMLFRLGDESMMVPAWRAAQRDWRLAESDGLAARDDDWIVQHALELAYQEGVGRALAAGGATPAPATPTAQVVFCIDVRSEVIRRALERVAPTVRTSGFAGFFGLPIAYRPLAGPPRPQLPGLLAPAMVVEDAGEDRSATAVSAWRRAAATTAWKGLGGTAASAFAFVEAAGLGWAAALVRDGFSLGRSAGDTLRGPAARGRLRPELVRRVDGAGGALDVPARVALAAGILRAMGLTRDFAPLLALVGHGASSENNPVAAGLQCGACGGQTGEVNARALAALLNDAEVRAGLAADGIDLAGTHVVAGLHDTTTDEVTLFDLDRVPASHTTHVGLLGGALAAAGAGARQERAGALGLAGTPDDLLRRRVRHRARDWSETRPEWGLAGNAAFIVAPRDRTRGVDLGGRAFLHDYDWRADAGFGTLELILTAPMVVTHWINMQYHASTVDPTRYGSGNKVLHNVVGGRVGVVEGAGGDLRIGLPLQSVHDGTRWMHEPLRLSVFVEAPTDAIDRILARHARVRDLVRHRWLFLFCLDPARGGRLVQRWGDAWRDVPAS